LLAFHIVAIERLCFWEGTPQKKRKGGTRIHMGAEGIANCSHP
jgi:hypothetical protein